MKYETHIKLLHELYGTMFLIQSEELLINHLTLLLVLTMPYACWFLWRANYIKNFKRCLHFKFGVAFWRVVLREVYFEGPNRVWRISILNTAQQALRLVPESFLGNHFIVMGNVREEPAVSYAWTGWVWGLAGWSSWRLQENYRSF